VGAWTDIPSTPNPVNWTLLVDWRSASNVALGTRTVRSIKTGGGGWTLGTATLVAPVGANRAVLRIVATGLRSTINIDDVFFTPLGG